MKTSKAGHFAMFKQQKIGIKLLMLVVVSVVA